MTQTTLKFVDVLQHALDILEDPSQPTSAKQKMRDSLRAAAKQIDAIFDASQTLLSSNSELLRAVQSIQEN